MKTFKKLLAVLTISLCLSGCNQAIIDKLPNGEIVEGKIKSWSDYEGEQLQIAFENGNTYLTTAINCAMIKYNN